MPSRRYRIDAAGIGSTAGPRQTGQGRDNVASIHFKLKENYMSVTRVLVFSNDLSLAARVAILKKQYRAKPKGV